MLSLGNVPESIMRYSSVVERHPVKVDVAGSNPAISVQSVAQLVEYYFWKVEVARSSRVTLITQDIFGKKNGSIPLIDSGEYLRG